MVQMGKLNRLPGKETRVQSLGQYLSEVFTKVGSYSIFLVPWYEGKGRLVPVLQSCPALCGHYGL